MRIRLLAFTFMMVGAVTLPSRADFSGFNNLVDYRYNQGDGGAAPGYDPVSDTFHITNQGELERRSIFHETPQQIAQFTATFTYYALNLAGSRQGLGACFILQNSADGPAALGGFHSGLGCSGIPKSVAVTLELANGTQSTSGVYTNGSLGGGSVSTNPVNFYNGHAVGVSIHYDGTFLRTTMTDLVTLQPYLAPPTLVNIPATVMGNTAFVGLSATTNYGGDQYFSNFTFSTVPEPASLGFLAVLAFALRPSRRSRHR